MAAARRSARLGLSRVAARQHAAQVGAAAVAPALVAPQTRALRSFFLFSSALQTRAERCFGFSHGGIGQSARRSATEEPQTPASSATSSATTTPAAAPAVWNGRGSHLTPRGDGDNALKEGDLEQSMMAAATAAKVKRGKQRPKSAAVLANTRDWSAQTSLPGLPATYVVAELLLWWQERGRCPRASCTGLRLRREHAH